MVKQQRSNTSGKDIQPDPGKSSSGQTTAAAVVDFLDQRLRDFGIDKKTVADIPAELKSEVVHTLLHSELKPHDRINICEAVAKKHISTAEEMADLHAVIAKGFSVGTKVGRILLELKEGTLKGTNIVDLADAIGIRTPEHEKILPRLYLQMVRAVSKDDRTRGLTAEAIKVLKAHRGQPGILHELMVSASPGSQNILLLPRMIQPLFPSKADFTRIAEEYNQRKTSPRRSRSGATTPEPEESDSTDQAGASRKKVTVRSASGQMIRTDRGVYFCSKSEPGNGVPVGLTAAGTLLDTLQAAEAAYQRKPLEDFQRAHRERQRTRAKKTIENIDLNALLNQPDLARMAGRERVADQLDVMQQLQRINQTLREQVQALLQADQLNEVQADLRELELMSDPGGSLFNWVERNLDTVPEEVRLAYDNLKHNYYRLTAEEESLCWETLSYFKIHNTYIQSGFAVQAFLDDVQYLSELPKQDPLRVEFRELLKKKSWLEKTVQKEAITLVELGEIISLPVLEFRAAIAKRDVLPYQETLEYLEQRCSGLFFEKGRFRDDCIALKLPWERLKEHLFVQRIGVSTDNAGKRARKPLLTRDEFSEVMQFCLFKSMYGNNLAQFCRAVSVPKMAELTESLRFITAKVVSLDNELAKKLSESELQRLCEENPPKAFTDSWKTSPVLLLGRRGEYGTATEFQELTGISLSELIAIGKQRADVTDFPTRGWNEHRQQVELAASLGYYPLTTETLLKRSAIKAKTLRRSDNPELGQVIQDALRVAENPLVHSWSTTIPRERFKKIAADYARGELLYLFPKEIKGLEELASFNQELKDRGLIISSRARKTSALIEHWSSLRSAQLLSRGARSTRSRMDVVSRKVLPDIPFATLQEGRRRSVQVKYYPPIEIARALENHAEAIDSKKIIPASKLSKRWFEMAQQRFSAGAGKRIADWADFKQRKRSKELAQPTPLFVDSALVDDINASLRAENARSRKKRS